MEAVAEQVSSRRGKARRLRFRRKLYLFNPVLRATALYYRAVRRVWPVHARHVRFHTPRALSRLILAAHGCRVAVRGLENIERLPEGPIVFMANHNSRLDAYLLLAHVPVTFQMFASDEAHVFKEGLGTLRGFCDAFELFFYHDKTSARATAREFQRARVALQAGGRLAFFPEGGMHSDRSVLMESFGPSCMRLAIQAGATVVPIVLSGTEYSFEYRTGPARVDVVMSFETPVPLAGVRPRDAHAMTEALRARMLERYREQVGQSAPDPAEGAHAPHRVGGSA
jgi:1-acyl-sn-glycerol-3-phosphate acyltransferase